MPTAKEYLKQLVEELKTVEMATNLLEEDRNNLEMAERKLKDAIVKSDPVAKDLLDKVFMLRSLVKEREIVLSKAQYGCDAVETNFLAKLKKEGHIVEKGQHRCIYCKGWVVVIKEMVSGLERAPSFQVADSFQVEELT